MCQQLMQFCSGSKRPLLFFGAFLTITLAAAIGYTACSANKLYNEIDSQVAASKALQYHLQLLACVYLVLMSAFSCYSAHYDTKHSIRILSSVSMFCFLLTLVTIFLVPSGQDVSQAFVEKLKQAAAKYDFKDKSAVNSLSLATTNPQEPVSMSALQGQNRSVRGTEKEELVPTNLPDQLSPQNATLIWDRLQARGCCGSNAATDWKSKLPKSCCAEPKLENDELACPKADDNHQQGCLALIGLTSLYLTVVLASVAFVSFYLSVISGIGAYKTYISDYIEASQSAYS